MLNERGGGHLAQRTDMKCAVPGWAPCRSGAAWCPATGRSQAVANATQFPRSERSGLRPGTVLFLNPSSPGSHSTVLVKRVRLLFPLVQSAISQSLTSPRNLRQMYINRTTRKDSGNYRKGSNRGMVICNGDAAVAIAFCSCSFLFAFCALCQ